MNTFQKLVIALVLSALFAGCDNKKDDEALTDQDGVSTSDEDHGSEDVPLDVIEDLRAVVESTPLMMQALETTKTIYISSEILRVKGTDEMEAAEGTFPRDPEPLYRVTHYRYENDTAIISIVDLDSREILTQDEFPHLPTSFTANELKLATKLAMNNEDVVLALGDYAGNVEVEGLMVHTSDEKDPWFGQRILRLMFKISDGDGGASGIGNSYLHEPIVIVNLTNESVYIEESRPTKTTIELPDPEDRS